MKPGTPALRSNYLLNSVRQQTHLSHYSRSTVKTHPYQVHFYSLAWSEQPDSASTQQGHAEARAFPTP
jgi:hypothetical protein